MAERNLPIKFFKKRQKDQLGTEGGGGGKLPVWISKEALPAKARLVRRALGNVSEALAEKVKGNNHIPSILKLKLHADGLAKTYRRELSGLFNLNKKLNIIGVTGEDELLIKIDNEKDLQLILHKFSGKEIENPTQTTLIGINAITNIRKFKPEITIIADKMLIAKVKLFNFGDSRLDDIMKKEFERFCKERKLVFDRTSYSADLNIFRVSGITKDALSEFEKFDGIQAVTEMPTYDMSMDEEISTESIPVKHPKRSVVYPVVGILDTGIAGIPHLKPWLEPGGFTKYQPSDVNKGHGTFVAGVLLYGDELQTKNYTGFDGCRLHEAIVMPDIKKQKIFEDELIEHIRDAINNREDIKIWNLSLGSSIEASLDQFSDFANALDEIQEEKDVLICKSVGNCRNFELNAPRGRIARAADTVRGLVVGSVGHDAKNKFTPSAFSRMGPAPAHIIKPDVVHVGGNAALNDKGKTISETVRSFHPNGAVTTSVGTSFSTPRVAAIAAGLGALLNEKFNPLLIKGLIIHSAKYPAESKLSIAEKINLMGFGLPGSVGNILYNEQNEITLILQDTLEKGTFIDILDFPFPQSMVDEDGYYYGEVTVTLAAAPILDFTQGAEYCQSNVDVMLGTYDEKVERDMTKPTIKNPIGADGRKNILYAPLYSRNAPKDFSSSFASERMLLTYGDKFQPIKKWCVNFDEFTPANKEKFLEAPKSWYLKVEGLFRHATETKFEQQRLVPCQEICVIVTIRDTKKRGNIYNEVTQLLDSFSFIHSNVKIREEVRVRLNS